MDILNTYLHNNGYKLVMDNEATNIYIENRDKFECCYEGPADLFLLMNNF